MSHSTQSTTPGLGLVISTRDESRDRGFYPVRRGVARTRAHQGPNRTLRGTLENTPVQYRHIGYVSRYQRMKIMGLTLLIIAGLAVASAAWFIPAADCLTNPMNNPLDGSMQACHNADDRRLGIQLIMFFGGLLIATWAFVSVWKHPRLTIEQVK